MRDFLASGEIMSIAVVILAVTLVALIQRVAKHCRERALSSSRRRQIRTA